ESLLGFNVTVPHKIAVMKHLDQLDPSAARVGAVNTIVRTADGRLLGANTDGVGFIATLLTPPPGEAAPLFPTLAGMNALVLGAGGSARAVAFALAEKLGSGSLLIANRTYENARGLAAEAVERHRATRAIREEEIAAAAADAQLIVNCTIKGQGATTGDM